MSYKVRYLFSGLIVLVVALLVLWGKGLVFKSRASVPLVNSVLVDALDKTPDGNPLSCGNQKNPCNTIQAAVQVAKKGDSIKVAKGVYKESVTIDKTVLLEGVGAKDTTINADGKDNVIKITADGVTVKGFTITGARLDGVLIEGVSGGEITDNIITKNSSLVIPSKQKGQPPTAFNGLDLRNSSNILVEGNTISDNARGIRIAGSELINVPEENIHVSVIGVSNGNTIRGNTVSDNKVACGIVLSTDSNKNIVEGNTVIGNDAGIVVSGLPPFGLPKTPFANHIPLSDDNTIKDNKVTDNSSVGIIIDPISGKADNNLVSGNTISGNGDAENEIGIKGKLGLAVVANIAPPSFADTNTFQGNTISNEDIGILVGKTSKNTQVDRKQSISVFSKGTLILDQTL